MKKFLMFGLFIFFAIFIFCGCKQTEISFNFTTLENYGVGDVFKIEYDKLLSNFDFDETLIQINGDTNYTKIVRNEIYCLKSGETNISLYYNGKEKSNFILKIKETPQQLNEISLNHNSITLQCGESINITDIFTYTPNDFDIASLNILYDNDIISFDKNIISAENVGETNFVIEDLNLSLKIFVEKDKYISNLIFSNLIDDKLILEPNYKGYIQFTADNLSNNILRFSTTSKAVSITNSGYIKVLKNGGSGNIVATYTDGLFSQKYINIPFEIVNYEIATIILQEETFFKGLSSILFLNTAYSCDCFNMLNIDILKLQEINSGYEIEFDFYDIGLQDIQIIQICKYSYYQKEVSVYNQKIKVFDKDALLIKYYYNEYEIDNLNLFLTSNCYSSADYPNKLKIIGVCNDELLVPTIESEDKNINILTNTVSGCADGNFELIVSFGKVQQKVYGEVKFLVANEIVAECDDVLYLNTKNSCEFSCVLDQENAYNNIIELENLTPNIIDISNNIITAKEIGVGKFKLTNGSLEKIISINIKYGVSNYEIYLNDEIQKSLDLELNKDEEYVFKIKLFSGNLIINDVFYISNLSDYKCYITSNPFYESALLIFQEKCVYSLEISAQNFNWFIAINVTINK